MSKALITESLLTNISKAIDSTNKTPAQMATTLQTAIASANTTTGESDTTIVNALQSLSSGYGGITPSGTIQITENGTVDVTNYASAEVDVSGGASDDYLGILSRTITTLDNDEIETLGTHSLSYGVFTSVSLPNLTSLGNGTFYSCSNLESVSLPNLTTVTNGTQVFYQCTKIKQDLYFPRLTFISGASQMFQACGNSNGGIAFAIRMPALITMQYNCQQCFNSCTNLSIVDLGPVTSSLYAQLFNNASSLTTIILRRSDAITPLANVSAFNGTPYASGSSGGTIYIPKALYDELGTGSSLDYKAATNWSTLDGYGTVTWAALEGSTYEATDW